MISIKTNNPLADYSNDFIYPEGVYFDNRVNHKFVDQIENLFRRPIKFLDIGCAGGNLALEFHRRGHLAVGVDGSDQCLNPRQDIVQQRGFLPFGHENWKNHYGKVLFTCDLAKPYEIQENGKPLKFDVISTWDVLEHIHPDNVDLALEMVSNHLEEGGVFLGNVALFSSLGLGNTPEIEYHQSVFPKEWWIEKLQKYFSLIKYPVFEHNRDSSAHLVFAGVKYPQKKLRKTVISHFYNEEYLLPWWLNHHREIFDHGIMIDYDSTDRSVEIIRKLCPTWTIVPSRNKEFLALQVDEEVMDIMAYIDGYKMALNTTEFLIGDLGFLDEPNAPSKIYMRCLAMVDPPEESEKVPTYDLPLLQQKYHGLNFENSFDLRYARLMHNSPEAYEAGRHYWVSHPDHRLAVVWYGWSPYTDKLLKRRRQIRDKIPSIDPASRESVINGVQHRWTADQEIKAYMDCVSKTEDLRPVFSQYGIKY